MGGLHVTSLPDEAAAHADAVLISGHDGGTGASPLTSLKHAGALWSSMRTLVLALLLLVQALQQSRRDLRPLVLRKAECVFE